MPFTFPNPQTTPEFTGTNGITYIWDVDDEKWKIQGFRAPGDYVKTKGGDEMEGPFKVDGSLEVTGGIDADRTRIQNVADPVGIFDAVNKQYADASAERLLTYQTAPTNMTINRYVDAAYYDEANHRILMWRNYFGRSNMTPHPHLIVGDPVTGDVTYLESVNPLNPGRREPISCPFHVGDDIFFVQAENPKDGPPIRLTPDNKFDHFGTLHFCRSWCVLNYHVPLSDRYHLFIGNPSERLDPNGGNGSKQAQATLFLDTEDLINQNQIETFDLDGVTYGTVTKTVNASRGGVPGVILKGTGQMPDVYLFQPGKRIHRFELIDADTKQTRLVDVGGGVDLPWDHLLDADGKRIAEKGKINGLTVLENRYIVWHALNVGIMWFDTDDNSLTNIYPTNNWIEYGCNKHKRHPNVPNIGDTLYFFPGDNKGFDGVDVYPELLVVNDDKTVEAIAIPDPDFKNTNSQRSTALEIVAFDQSENLTAYNVNDRRFERYVSSEKLQTAIAIIDPDSGESVQKIIPWVTGAGSDPNSFKNCRILELKESLDEEIIADLNLLANPIIEDHENDINNLLATAGQGEEALAKIRTNEDSIISTRDGLADFIAAEVLLATEDETFVNENLTEHAVACWPTDDHPLYHLIPQDYILMTRMFEGSKKTEDDRGDVITDNKSLDSDNYGNDDLKNVLILHIPTGKIKDISTFISHNAYAVDTDGRHEDKYPALRGHTVIPRDNGDVDVYSWIHNPRRNPNSQPGAGQPLYRIHIPANPDPSDPFAGVTGQHTDIFCDPALLTTPDENPYDIYDKNTSKDLKYQYEISQVAWDFIDSDTGKRHHFLMSYNKGSRDYVTQRVFEINFDESDPDKGTITPVAAHADSTHGEYASGFHVIKKDTNDVFRCFLYGSPCGLTELYFTGDYQNRTAEIKNYGSYIPLGDRVVDPDGAVNGIGKPLIIGKGIVDNWYKSTTLAPQFLTQGPIDKDDYFSNIIVWYQSAYGVCTLNIQDLGAIDRSDEVHLNNNYQGTERELSSMMIETKEFYDSYLQDSSSRNLMRFNVKQPNTHSHGCLYFFDYKADYKYDHNADGSITNYGEEKTLYNSTRNGAAGSSGKDQDQILFKRPILEVKPNYKTGRIEVHAIVTGSKHHPSNKELGYHETFNGESITKFGDVFVCAGAAKSHSSVTEPRVYVFDPDTRQIQRVSNTEVNSTSLIPVPDHGLVIGAAYGPDSDGNFAPVYMTSMTAIQKVVNERKNAAVLRKLCQVTGEDPATVDGTWALTKKPVPELPPYTGKIEYGDDFDVED